MSQAIKQPFNMQHFQQKNNVKPTFVIPPIFIAERNMFTCMPTLQTALRHHRISGFIYMQKTAENNHTQVFYQECERCASSISECIASNDIVSKIHLLSAKQVSNCFLFNYVNTCNRILTCARAYSKALFFSTQSHRLMQKPKPVVKPKPNESTPNESPSKFRV
jgi:hypothetical protein